MGSNCSSVQSYGVPPAPIKKSQRVTLGRLMQSQDIVDSPRPRAGKRRNMRRSTPSSCCSPLGNNFDRFTDELASFDELDECSSNAAISPRPSALTSRFLNCSLESEENRVDVVAGEQTSGGTAESDFVFREDFKLHQQHGFNNPPEEEKLLDDSSEGEKLPIHGEFHLLGSVKRARVLSLSRLRRLVMSHQGDSPSQSSILEFNNTETAGERPNCGASKSEAGEIKLTTSVGVASSC